MFTSFFRHQREDAQGASLRRISQRALLAGLLLSAMGATADVGLAAWDGPLLPGPVTSLEDSAVTRQISARADLSCDTSHSGARASLNFAPPSDFRPGNSPPAQLPLVVRGNQAVLYTGQTKHTASARLHEGRLVFISSDDGFFDSLKRIQPGDQLLIHTAQTLRQYQITAARLSDAVTAEGAEEESLSLLACYPFQPLASEPVFYELRARPLTPESSLSAGQGTRLINF